MAEVDLLLKLFDTLKDASKDNYQLAQALLTNQNNIGNYIRSLPLDDLKQALKDHSKDSSDEIGTCKETVETKSDDILTEVKKISSKIKTMIIVVVVAFTLFGAASLIGVIAYNTRAKTDAVSKEAADYKSKQHEHDQLKKEIIESVRDEFRKK